MWSLSENAKRIYTFTPTEEDLYAIRSFINPSVISFLFRSQFSYHHHQQHHQAAGGNNYLKERLHFSKDNNDNFSQINGKQYEEVVL